MSDSSNRDEERSSFELSGSDSAEDGIAEGASDSFSETTTKSWGEKIAESIKGVLVGVGLIAASIGGLFWNEGRAVQTARSLTEGAGLVVQANSARVDAANEGKLVHVSGDTKAAAPVADAEFGVSLPALKLVRVAEMYQWKEETKSETKKKLGGGEETVTTYEYVRVWSDKPIDSGKFRHPQGHGNPQMRYQQRDFVAANVELGAFRPGERVLRLLPANTEVPLEPKAIDAARERLGPAVAVLDGRIYVGVEAAQPRTDGRPAAAPNPSQPRIGDQRISYRIAPVGPVSAIGRQTGPDLAPFQTKAGDALLLVRPGVMSSADMFTAAQRDNTMLTWALRAGGAILMFIGFGMILKPLVAVADVVPLIGDILGAGAGLVSIVLTLILAPIVIAVAWFWYRPITAAIVLAVSALGVAGWIVLSRRRRAVLKPRAA
jgi:hypothetical protein